MTKEDNHWGFGKKYFPYRAYSPSGLFCKAIFL